MFMSSDDYFYPSKLYHLFEEIKLKNANWGFGKYVIDQDSQISELHHPGWEFRQHPAMNDVAALLACDHYAFLAATIFKKSALPIYSNSSPWDLSLFDLVGKDGLGDFRAQDWAIALEVSQKSESKVVFLNEYVAAFRQVPNQLSSPDNYIYTGRSACEMSILINKFLSKPEYKALLPKDSPAFSKMARLFLSKINNVSNVVKQSANFREIYLPHFMQTKKILLDY